MRQRFHIFKHLMQSQEQNTTLQTLHTLKLDLSPSQQIELNSAICLKFEKSFLHVTHGPLYDMIKVSTIGWQMDVKP